MSNLNINGIIKSTGGGETLMSVDLIVEQGNNYIRYYNGLQILFWKQNISSKNQSNIATPMPFIDDNWVGVVCGVAANYGNESIVVQSSTTFQLIGETNANPHNCIAIGKWK